MEIRPNISVDLGHTIYACVCTGEEVLWMGILVDEGEENVNFVYGYDEFTANDNAPGLRQV